jgi:putative ABC transport system substrate-binding protein
MDRRTFTTLLAAMPLTGRNARAQDVKPRARLAYVRIAPPLKENVDAFEAGLLARGLHPNVDYVLIYRDAKGKPEQLPAILSDLIAGQVDVLVVGGSLVAKTAQQMTTTIPIVLAAAGDPLALGLVKSLARPGGNITGNSIVNVASAGKRVELLRVLAPGIRRVAVLHNATNPALLEEWKAARDAATPLGIECYLFEVNGTQGFEGAFARIKQRGSQALIVLEDPMFNTERHQLVAHVTKARIPAVYGQRAPVDAGGLMSYGPNFSQLFRNAAVFVDKILKGARPGDLPIEQPSKFELIVNASAARAIGLVVPPEILLRADEVING